MLWIPFTSHSDKASKVHNKYMSTTLLRWTLFSIGTFTDYAQYPCPVQIIAHILECSTARTTVIKTTYCFWQTGKEWKFFSGKSRIHAIKVWAYLSEDHDVWGMAWGPTCYTANIAHGHFRTLWLCGLCPCFRGVCKPIVTHLRCALYITVFYRPTGPSGWFHSVEVMLTMFTSRALWLVDHTTCWLSKAGVAMFLVTIKQVQQLFVPCFSHNISAGVSQSTKHRRE